MLKFIGKFIRKYIKPWFFSKKDPDRIRAPYAISFVFLSLTVWSIVIHLTIKLWQFRKIVEVWDQKGISSLPEIEKIAQIDITLVPLITVLIGTAGMFIGLYNWGKDKPAKNENNLPEQGDGTISSDEV